MVKHCRQWGTIVIVSDGDVVFQSRKSERSGLADAAAGNLLVYAHNRKTVFKTLPIVILLIIT
ncbi:MAG: hypothetical protein M3Z35_06615 [Nitrospirota bacterium]|nr:hypothetical protein [Nitrospirota bacterium]